MENLFDAQTVGTEYDDYTVKRNWTKRMVDIKLNHVAEVICDLDADILGLQEIENNNIFEQLQKRLTRVGCGYRYAAISSKKGATIQVALLSRFPIKKKKELQVSYSPRVRNILEVEVNVKGEPLLVFVNHWKSRAYKGFESKRMKYAKVLQKRLLTLASSKAYLLLGDFNTDYDAHFTLEKKINDTKGKTGLHHVLNIVDSNNTLIDANQMTQAKKGQHYTLWKELPFDQRWNTKFYGQKGTADHIVLSSALFDGKGLEYVNHSFKVLKLPYLFTKKGYINRWQYKKGKHRGKGYSDHLPVYAYFDNVPYMPSVRVSKRKAEPKMKKIESLYTLEHLEQPIILEDVLVIWKQRNNALIKQSKEGRGIFLFGSAKMLEEGKRYDLLVQAIKSYKGLKEVTHLRVLKELGSENIEPFIWEEKALFTRQAKRQNERFQNLVGTYSKGKLLLKEGEIAIYFRKKKSKPREGQKLKIHKALLGYYKQIQLVVFDPKDFNVMER